MTGILVYDGGDDDGSPAMVYAHVVCVRCRQAFSCNPNRVPSISINGAPRAPICRACVDVVNVARKKNGVPLIVPLEGAYEPAPESEIDWNG